MFYSFSRMFSNTARFNYLFNIRKQLRGAKRVDRILYDAGKDFNAGPRLRNCHLMGIRQSIMLAMDVLFFSYYNFNIACNLWGP